jgi:hypothetical protein
VGVFGPNLLAGDAFPMIWKAVVLPRAAAKRMSEGRLDASADGFSRAS